MATTEAIGPLSGIDHASELRRAVIAATVGTTIEETADGLSARLDHRRRPGAADRWLYGTNHSGMSIAIYMALCCVITVVATALLKDYTGKDIADEYDA